MMDKRSLCGAAVAIVAKRDAVHLRLIREIAGQARAWEEDDSNQHGTQELIAALERRPVGMSCPIEFESDLCDLAIVRPAGGDLIGAMRRTAAEEHHIRMLGLELVEDCPVAMMIIAVDAAGECNSGALRAQVPGVGVEEFFGMASGAVADGDPQGCTQVRLPASSSAIVLRAMSL